MAKTKILVADDEARMRKLICDFLTAAGYDVTEAEDGEQAVDLFFGTGGFGLVILDVMMPLMDGFEVCRTIREYSKVPVVMLTARTAERDELTGFGCGADEYISKPFSPKILVARVEALLRRSGADKQELLTAEGITLDKSAHEVTVDGKPVDLSFKEFELLAYLMENRGIALSREKILNNVWDYDYFGDARTIDTHIKKLRGKLGGRGDYIRTIWRMGYKFDDRPADKDTDEG
ncbi:MAG: response regulator transcription factor [Lachnospiraceae bacterium]|nr:response regulator transcription factor [Lachnospiraceae bacterium]MBQ3400979.1 response regulator transcription factor [Lachnospiraceae bacterium]MBQ4308854.1 response regulator transcription factor [Lachnospiraceae bacterium]